MYTLAGGHWSQTGELTSSDGNANDSFGGSVSVSGTTAVVGAPFHKVGSHASQGAAYVYTLSGGSWSQTGELTASDGAANDTLGSSVAVSAATVVVGAPVHMVAGHASQGAAYVFTLGGGTWSQTGELTASDGAANDTLGSSVSVSGTAVVAGAPVHAVCGHASQGAVYVFTLSASFWSQTGELTASDGNAGDRFGASAAVSGTTELVGARSTPRPVTPFRAPRTRCRPVWSNPKGGARRGRVRGWQPVRADPTRGHDRDGAGRGRRDRQSCHRRCLPVGHRCDPAGRRGAARVHSHL